MLSYEEAIEKINNSEKYGDITGSESMSIILNKIGHPENGLKFIHVAGTNGKGSTCAFLDSIFRKCGYKVGLFTSPHLLEFEERIRVNNEMITKEKLTEYMDYLYNSCTDIRVNYFDYCLAIALLYFRDEKTDIAIIETGVGGLYDQTNAIGVPVCSVITKIGYDHMTVLGNTISEIAYQKAGIIKCASPVFSTNQEEAAIAVIKDYSEKINSGGLFITDQDTIDHVRKLKLGLIGEYQIENAALAYSAARYILDMRLLDSLAFYDSSDTTKIDINANMRRINTNSFDSVVNEGIEEAFWPGRMEIVSRKPFFLIDGAHNSNGVKALKESLEGLWPDEKFHIIMGVMSDKDYEEMLDIIFPLAKDFCTVTPGNSRSLEGSNLAELIEKRGLKVSVLGSTSDIPGVLKEDAKNIAMGSLYFIAEIKKLYDKSNVQ